MIDSMKQDMKNIYKRFGKIIKLILILMLFYYINYSVYIVMMLFNISKADLNGASLVLLNAFTDILLMFILFIIYRKDLIKDWDKFRANPIDNFDAGIKYWFVGLLGMIASNVIINILFTTGGAGNEKAVQSMISNLPWMMLIDAGIIGPFIEEIVFRKTFKDACKNKWLFVIISSLVFGALHVTSNIVHWYDALYIIPYTCLGLSFALSYKETDTIFTSMFMHMIHNSVLILSSIFLLGLII